jgi:hypothetical protein
MELSYDDKNEFIQKSKASKTTKLLENAITKWVAMSYFFSPFTRFGECLALGGTCVSF